MSGTMTGGVRGAMLLLACLCVHGRAAAQEVSTTRSMLQEMIQSVSYGVPASPAFELLPGKPSEVVRIATPHDISTSLLGLLNGTRLRTGAAFDIRPLATMAGSLREYQSGSLLNQIAWRTVLAVGTIAAPDASGDVLLSAGIRIPLIDRGDPRADKEYADRLQRTFINGLDVQPGLNDPDAAIDSLTLNAAKNLEPIREEWIERSWNAFRVDIGLAGMLRSRGGSLKADNLKGQSLGAWAATSFGIGTFGEVTASLKYTSTATEIASQESDNIAIGARGRAFASGSFAISLEGARVWSIHDDMPGLDEQRTHLAALAEIRISYIGGWLGIGYGGDPGRSGDPQGKLSLHYAIYRDPLISK